MSYRSTYYLDSTNYMTATAVFTDEALSVKAVDGFYSFGLYVRQQVGGILLPAQLCPTCTGGGEGCGISVDVNSYERGIFYTEVDTGPDTGVIVIKFNPFSVPIGIKVEMWGIDYRTLNSWMSGALGVLTGESPVFLGQNSSDCGIEGGSPNIPEWRYANGDYSANGSYSGITVASSELSLTDDLPGVCVMVIPKPTASPSLVTVTTYGLCPDSRFFLEVLCPANSIHSLSSSDVQTTSILACEAALTQTYYRVIISGTDTDIAVNDMIFTDQGVTILPTGYYKYGTGWFQINAYGAVADLGTC